MVHTNHQQNDKARLQTPNHDETLANSARLRSQALNHEEFPNDLESQTHRKCFQRETCNDREESPTGRNTDKSVAVGAITNTNNETPENLISNSDTFSTDILSSHTTGIPSSAVHTRSPPKPENDGWVTVLSKADKRNARRRSKTTGSHTKSGNYHRILTLNVNSINDKKLCYLADYLMRNPNSVIAITELVSENSELNNLIRSNSKFPILNHNSAKRVGLMIPKYLESCSEVVDTFNVIQLRKRKSQTVCQTTTFKLTFGKIVEVITVVYCAPDATSNSRFILRKKLLEYSRKFQNYISIGDFNADFEIKKNRDEYKTDFGGILSQIVDVPTRRASKKIGDVIHTSSTRIDLAFVSDQMKNRLVAPPKTYTDSPSDHFMVECTFNLNVPKSYVTYEYYLDTTRRPPLKRGMIEVVVKDLQAELSRVEPTLERMNQTDIISYVQATLRTILDRHNPLNSSGLHTKKIYSFTMSKKLRDMRKERNLLYNKYRYAKRNSSSKQEIEIRYNAYKKSRNACTSLTREEQSSYKVSIIDDGLANSKHIWDFIKKFHPDKTVDTSKTEIVIDGMKGIDLANKMASYLLKRARLVPTGEVEKNSAFIPYPKIVPEMELDIDDTIHYDVEALFETKKKANLSCGPDTISLKHIKDLMPVLKPILQKAVNKPLTGFVDIKNNFNRLISKMASSIDKPLTVKSQRPLAELDALPKYACIKVFVDQLKRLLIPFMKDNQYSFPGKGSPMAIVKILDTFALHAAQKKKTILAIWDFSNAFCTIIHDVILKIAEKYNLSKRLLKLLSEFLEQSFSTIKMSDKNGFYKSEEIHTQVGCQQGQIGSDFIFALANENIAPEPLFNEFIERIKYVDDFNDIMASNNASELITSLKHNIGILLKMATSVGLKLNDDKTKFMFAHLSDSEICEALSLVVPAERLDEAITESKSYTHKLLGFNFSIHNNRISVDSAVDSLIDRLNGCCRIVSSMRKHGLSLPKVKLRIEIATKLIWSACYDIGLCYAYASNPQFERIEKCIRKVIKSSGLDWMTPSDIVNILSTRLPPKTMAIKQILQLGIKFLNPEEIKNKRFNVPRRKTDNLRPFWRIFLNEFEKLPLKLREHIIELLDPTDLGKMDKIKSALKSHFLKLAYPNGEPKHSKIDCLISKHIYSSDVVETRKRKYEDKVQREKFNTPTAKRSRLSSKLNMRLMTKCLAPHNPERPTANRARRSSKPRDLLEGPGKNKEPPDKTVDTPVRYLKRHRSDKVE